VFTLLCIFSFFYLYNFGYIEYTTLTALEFGRILKLWWRAAWRHAIWRHHT